MPGPDEPPAESSKDLAKEAREAAKAKKAAEEAKIKSLQNDLDDLAKENQTLVKNLEETIKEYETKLKVRAHQTAKLEDQNQVQADYIKQCRLRLGLNPEDGLEQNNDIEQTNDIGMADQITQDLQKHFIMLDKDDVTAQEIKTIRDDVIGKMDQIAKLPGQMVRKLLNEMAQTLLQSTGTVYKPLNAVEDMQAIRKQILQQNTVTERQNGRGVCVN